ncbi:uncharacterized protein LOC130744311 [Lotus japonicus]|uniref:uncharacterized protein LOC130744311 n=1 Tax=Lotus japonicus TaxID=34305 RepID=UPI00258D5B96|nr:uncharacterized protein LOC130744311 [Lotus japonicus]
MAPRPICNPICVDMEDILHLNVPGSKQLASSSLLCINEASYASIYPKLNSEKIWGNVTFSEATGFIGETIDYDFCFDMNTPSVLLKVPIGGAQYQRYGDSESGDSDDEDDDDDDDAPTQKKMRTEGTQGATGRNELSDPASDTTSDSTSSMSTNELFALLDRKKKGTGSGSPTSSF